MQKDTATHRQSKRHGIADFFALHIGEPISSAMLHARFGSSLRTRISEINHSSEFSITIRNETRVSPDGEMSVYTATPRDIPATFPEFGDLSPEVYPD
jgi:hypothetical protein